MTQVWGQGSTWVQFATAFVGGTVVALMLADDRAIPAAPSGYTLLGSEVGATYTLAVYGAPDATEATFTADSGTTIGVGCGVRVATTTAPSLAGDSGQSTSNPLTVPIPAQDVGDGVVVAVLHVEPEFDGVNPVDPSDYGLSVVTGQLYTFGPMLNLNIAIAGDEGSASVDFNFDSDTEGMGVAVGFGVPNLGYSYPDVLTAALGGAGGPHTSWSPSYV